MDELIQKRIDAGRAMIEEYEQLEMEKEAARQAELDEAWEEIRRDAIALLPEDIQPFANLVAVFNEPPNPVVSPGPHLLLKIPDLVPIRVGFRMKYRGGHSPFEYEVEGLGKPPYYVSQYIIGWQDDVTRKTEITFHNLPPKHKLNKLDAALAVAADEHDRLPDIEAQCIELNEENKNQEEDEPQGKEHLTKDEIVAKKARELYWAIKHSIDLPF